MAAIPDPIAALKDVTLQHGNKTAVISGGSSGIGAAVARLYAKLGCSRIIILGRSESSAKTVLEEMKALAPQGTLPSFEFVKGDLSTRAGMRAAADEVQNALGDGKIDYLIMCQNGTPSGLLVENEDGWEIGMATQAISRFAISYLLTTRGCLAPAATIFSIANAGQSLDDLDINDLSLKDRMGKKWRQKLFIEQSQRDSTIIDSFLEEIAVRYPQHRVGHIYPGVVKSKELGMVNGNPFPPPFNVGFWLALKLIGVTPDQFVPVPVTILTVPKYLPEPGHVRLYGMKGNIVPMGKWPSDPANRQLMWEKLKEMIGEK